MQSSYRQKDDSKSVNSWRNSSNWAWCLLSSTGMEPGYLCKWISSLLRVPVKSLFLQALRSFWDLTLWNASSPLLTRILTLAKVTNKRLHDVISCASETGLDDNPLSPFALKVEACLLGLYLGTNPAKSFCPNFYLNAHAHTKEEGGEWKNAVSSRKRQQTLSLLNSDSSSIGFQETEWQRWNCFL